ncbi:MAG: trypsin-like peptidase domain-containing protein [Candidatus Dormibacteria bacterium]
MVLEARRPSRWRTAVISLAISVLALLAIGAVAFAVGQRHGQIGPDDWRPLVPTAEVSPTPSLLPLSDVARDALGRVVTVEVIRDGAQALGTGWLLDDAGDFVTNAHVVQSERGVRIRDRAGHTHIGRIVGTDREQDLAVIRSTDGFSGVALPVHRGPLTVPQDVVMISASRATGHEDVITDRMARIHVDVPVRGNPDIDPTIGTTTVVYRDMLGLDGARIYSGNSGGPVLDPRGRVIGIVTLASRAAPQAFAIPIARVIDQLTAMARQPVA